MRYKVPLAINTFFFFINCGTLASAMFQDHLGWLALGVGWTMAYQIGYVFAYGVLPLIARAEKPAKEQA